MIDTLTPQSLSVGSLEGIIKYKLLIYLKTEYIHITGEWDIEG